MKTFKQTLHEAALDGQRDQSKTTVGKQTDTTMEAGDVAYAVLKRNHPDVHHYITRQAPIAIDPVQTLKMVKQIGSATTLMMMKNHFKEDAKKLYSSDFPLAESDGDKSPTRFHFEQTEPTQDVLDFHMEKQENSNQYKNYRPYRDDEEYHHYGYLPSDAMIHGKMRLPSGETLKGWMKPYPSVYHMTKDLWTHSDADMGEYSNQNFNTQKLDKMVRHARNMSRKDFGGKDMKVKSVIAHFTTNDFPIQTVHMSNGTHDVSVVHKYEDWSLDPHYEIHHSGDVTKYMLE